MNRVIIDGMKARVSYLEWYSRRRTHEMLMNLVDRLMKFREESGYNEWQEKTLGHKPDPDREVNRRIKQSFSNALKVTNKNQAYKNRLRVSEVQLLMNFKNMSDKGYMFDFDPIIDITNKFMFFAKFPTNLRQRIISKSALLTFTKSEIIFKQGDMSPDIFFMLRGTCAVKYSKPEWGGIEVCIFTVYDG